MKLTTRNLKGAQLQRQGSARLPETKTRCRWFALCDNPAVTTEPHPILGDVPICQRCADLVAKWKEPRAS